jgi:hypothetical protein
MADGNQSYCRDIGPVPALEPSSIRGRKVSPRTIEGYG